MNVLVIPEDFRKDQYILKPVIEKMLAAAGKEHAKVRVCLDPLLGGVREALKWKRIEEILRRYGMVDLFLLCVDRDGQEGRKAQLDTLEKNAGATLKEAQAFFGENAWQELEVWLLAGLDLPAEWSWKEIRQEPNPKEVYFLPLAKEQGYANVPGEGRKQLAETACRRYSRIRRKCPEDVAALEERIRTWLEKVPALS